MNGDPAVLSREHTWDSFLHYVRDGGGWRGADYALPSFEPSATPTGWTSEVMSLANQFQNDLVLDEDGDMDDLPLRGDD